MFSLLLMLLLLLLMLLKPGLEEELGARRCSQAGTDLLPSVVLLPRGMGRAFPDSSLVRMSHVALEVLIPEETIHCLSGRHWNRL